MEYHPGPLFPTPKPRPQPKPPKSLLLGLILAGCSYQSQLTDVTCQRFHDKVPEEESEVVHQKLIGVAIYYTLGDLNSENLRVCIPTERKYQIGLEARF